MANVRVDDKDIPLLMGIYGDLQVLKATQSEINRRVGVMEKSVKENLVDDDRVTAIEDKMDENKRWWSWLLQTVGGVLVVSIVVGIGNFFGIELSW